MTPDTAARTEQDCTTLECLVLDGCHALDTYRAHPCLAHAEQLEDAHAALLAAVAQADAELCNDLLGVAGELEQELALVRWTVAQAPPSGAPGSSGSTASDAPASATFDAERRGAA